MQTFIEQFAELIELNDMSNLSAETELTAVEEWDSLAQLSYILFVDEKFERNISGEQLAACVTVSDLYELTL